MKARTLKLKTLAIASAVTIAGCTLALSQSNVVIAAEAPAVTQQVAKMTNAQLYAGLEITQDPRYIAVHNEAWGTSTLYYLPNRIGYTLGIVNAKTAEGKSAAYKFFCPLEITNWGSVPGQIQHTGGAPVGQAAPYALQVSPCGFTTDCGITGDITTKDLNDCISYQQSLPDTVEAGMEYTDIVDEGNTIRCVVSYTRPHAISGEMLKGLYGIVEDKTTKKVIEFSYYERADLFDVNRAATVVYSILPQ